VNGYAPQVAASPSGDAQLLRAERAALARVASLVAHAPEPTPVFAAVARELRQVLDADATRIVRHEPDGVATVVASDGWAFDELATKLTTPIVIHGRRWGAVASGWRRSNRQTARVEERMAQLTEILSIAMAEAEARIELRRLHDQLGRRPSGAAAGHQGELLDPRDRAPAEEWGPLG
jgi:GAF domain-containing protein